MYVKRTENDFLYKCINWWYQQLFKKKLKRFEEILITFLDMHLLFMRKQIRNTYESIFALINFG